MPQEASDPTELAGVADAETQPAYAWSADEDYPATGSWEDPDRWLTPRRITILATVGSLAAVAGATILGFYLLRPIGQSVTHVVVATATSTAVVTVAPPPPPPKPTTITVRPPASTVRVPAPALPVQLTGLDYAFVQKVQQDGFTGTTDDLIAAAASVCRDLQHGKDLPEISRDLAAIPGNDLTVSQAHMFASEVLLTYPTCHS